MKRIISALVIILALLMTGCSEGCHRSMIREMSALKHIIKTKGNDGGYAASKAPGKQWSCDIFIGYNPKNGHEMYKCHWVPTKSEYEMEKSLDQDGMIDWMDCNSGTCVKVASPNKW